MESEEVRVGVFVCHCGLNIEGTVDCAAVAGYATNLPDVAHSVDLMFACSDDGQSNIKKAISEHDLNRIVVASCTPRTHEPVFRECIESAGLNPYLYDQVNLREHVSWCHMGQREKATEKAKRLIKMSIERVRNLEPLDRHTVPVVRRTAVIGGGVAGISAALDLAKAGFQTYLIEKRPTIGGQMALLDKVFPQNDCSICILGPIMSEVGRHPRIELMTYSEVDRIEGYVGNFRVKVRKKARFVDTQLCNACRDCEEVCPSVVKNEYEFGLGSRKAVYIPFPQATPNAHTITKRGTAACRIGCPAHVNAQAFIALMNRGEHALALDMVRKSIPFPATLGRVCPGVCQSECARGSVDESIDVRNLHRWLADYESENGTYEPVEVNLDKDERVAVIGAGPAGIACAEKLAMYGYPVTIYEARDKPGGLLRWGIPEHRLPRDILDSEIKMVKDKGVEIKLGSKIDSCSSLFEEGYKAVFLGTGAPMSRRLDIPGEEAEGVVHALEFLDRVNTGKTVELGNNVAIIGGGNAAVDAARVARRLGARTVQIIYRRSREEMPAIAQEIDDAEEEGIKLTLLAAPLEVKAADGRAQRLRCIKMRLGEPDESGRRRPIPIPDSEFTMKIDNVIVAVGQGVDALGPHAELSLTKWGTPEINQVTLETSLKGVFAGGDIVTSGGLVIDAVAAGQIAAESIHRYLRGMTLTEGREHTYQPIPLDELGLDEVKRQPRYDVPKMNGRSRIKSFDEVEKGYDAKHAFLEANRCLSCGVCSECMRCVDACPKDAIDHLMEDRIEEIEVGTIVVATGFDIYDPSQTREFGYGVFENVITNVQLERLTNAAGITHGKVKRPSDQEVPKSVAFVQCVGSRDRRMNQDYCCYYGCENSLKQATQIKEKYPETEVALFAMDIRTHGLGYESLYRRAREMGAIIIKGRPSEIEENPETKSLTVLAEDLYTGELLQKTYDLVVLTTAIIPNKDTPKLSRILNVSTGEYGFLTEAHPKLRPVDSFRDGIFLAGAVLGPMDIPKAVAYGKAAAAGAQSLMSPGQFSVEPIYAEIDTEQCIDCDLCSEICPFSAITGEKEERKVMYELCQGCGTCAAACPQNAIDVQHYRTQQVMPQVRAAARPEGGAVK
ncbi:MAG: FAD-dependent oxidoreductase [Candidatus Thorarchaeota archaeon]